MKASIRTSALSLLGFALAFAPLGRSQQLVARGPFGTPVQVLDETGEWTSPLEVASDVDVKLYVSDVTSPDWLKQNYMSFTNRGTYSLTMFTLYRTPNACRTNQTNWGLGDAAHLQECGVHIGYRIRQGTVDAAQKTVTLRFAAMVDKKGYLIASSLNDSGAFRTWDQLDANTLAGLRKADALVRQQMKSYDESLRNAR